MDKKTRIFFTILAIVTILSIIFTYRRAFVTHNYDLISDSENILE